MDESETAVLTPATPSPPPPPHPFPPHPPTNKEQPGIFMEDICAGKINVLEIKMAWGVGGGLGRGV